MGINNKVNFFFGTNCAKASRRTPVFPILYLWLTLRTLCNSLYKTLSYVKNNLAIHLETK